MSWCRRGVGNPQWKSSNNLPYPLSWGELFIQLVDTGWRRMGRAEGRYTQKAMGKRWGLIFRSAVWFFLAGCEKAALFLSVQGDHRAPLYHGTWRETGRGMDRGLNNLKFQFNFRISHPKLNMDDILVACFCLFVCLFYYILGYDRFSLLFIRILFVIDLTKWPTHLWSQLPARKGFKYWSEFSGQVSTAIITFLREDDSFKSS